MHIARFTAIEKLMSHSGITLPELLQLQKNDIDLSEKTILCRFQKNGRIRKTTIRPDDVRWFVKWLPTVSEKLFPIGERSVHYGFSQRSPTIRPFDLRKKLTEDMISLKAPRILVATKLGHFVHSDYPEEKSRSLLQLQEFEEKHYGEEFN